MSARKTVILDPKKIQAAREGHEFVKALFDGFYARRLPPGECAYCDEHGDDPMMPRHMASSRCESGKRPHCTCDTCF
jgi:hypothetical protein